MNPSQNPKKNHSHIRQDASWELAYWASEEGLSQRLGQLSGRIVYGLYNKYIQHYARQYGAKGHIYHTAFDERVCELCWSYDGEVYPLGRFLPVLPRHPNCLLAGTKVHTFDGIKSIENIRLGEKVLTHNGRYREVIQLHQNHHYSGLIYNHNGQGWMTVKHPVLTTDGWMPAEDINTATEVIFVKPEYKPTRLSESSFLTGILNLFPMRRMPLSAVNFNTQLKNGKGKIKVKNIKSVLRNNIKPSINKLGVKPFFKPTLTASQLSTSGSFNQLTMTTLQTTYSVMSLFNLFISLLRSHLTPLQRISLGLVANMHPCFNQTLTDGATIDTINLTEPIFTFTSNIPRDNFFSGKFQPINQHQTPTKINNTDIKKYNGCVYNLSVDEDESYLIGTGLAVHNCRCWLEPYWESEEVVELI